MNSVNLPENQPAGFKQMHPWQQAAKQRLKLLVMNHREFRSANSRASARTACRPAASVPYSSMETRKRRSRMDREEAEVSQVPPKRSPKNAAGSVNPREQNAFYQAVVDQTRKRGDKR